jgi:rSAM/selenodomain-associated transferase 1
MPEAETQCVLGLFAKQPLPGAAKTRLAQDTSPDFAARLAEAMLRDTLLRFRNFPALRVLAFAPPAARHVFAEMAEGGFTLTPQREGDLGARMEGFFREQLEQSERVVLLGSDSPTLPVDYVKQAFEALRRADVVLGPACDGGYYLIGCRRPFPEGIFREVAWGETCVLGQTVKRLPADRQLELLPPWYDVDTLEDLEMLKGHLFAMRRAGRNLELPHLESLLGV